MKDDFKNKDLEKKNLASEEVDLDDLDDLDEFDDCETVILTGDDGKEIEFVIIDEVEYKNNKFVLMVESDKADLDEADATIFKQILDDDESITYEEIGDEDFDAVAEMFSGNVGDYDLEF